MEAIYNAVKYGDPAVKALARGFPYRADPKTIDFFAAPSRSLSLCEAGACGGDCLPYDTLVFRRDGVLAPIGYVTEGDVIMGDGGWTTVTHFWDKGVRSLIELDLSNGGTLRCTPDHRLLRVPKAPRKAPGSRENAEEVRAGEVKPGDDLLVPESIPVGPESLETDRAWLLGVYIADGWSDNGGHGDNPVHRASISGLDGKPKEAQKRRVVEICDRYGWNHRWNRKYVAINNAEVAHWLSASGVHAFEKRVPGGLVYDKATTAALIEGLQADACKQNALVHGTTSPLLAVQLRVMYRMLGYSTHVTRVDDHGGFGKHPIYRVTVRARPEERKDGKNMHPFARVRAIREGTSEPVCDIETDSHRFWLPETDLVVHNCDEHTTLIAALAGSLGFTVGARAYAPRSSEPFIHVYAVALLPKKEEDPERGTVTGLDTTVDSAYVGWQPSPGRYRTAWVTGD